MLAAILILYLLYFAVLGYNLMQSVRTKNQALLQLDPELSAFKKKWLYKIIQEVAVKLSHNNKFYFKNDVNCNLSLTMYK